MVALDLAEQMCVLGESWYKTRRDGNSGNAPTLEAIAGQTSGGFHFFFEKVLNENEFFFIFFFCLDPFFRDVAYLMNCWVPVIRQLQAEFTSPSSQSVIRLNPVAFFVKM